MIRNYSVSVRTLEYDGADVFRFLKTAAGRLSWLYFVTALAAGLFALCIKPASDWQALVRDAVLLLLFIAVAVVVIYLVPEGTITQRRYRRRSRKHYPGVRIRGSGRGAEAQEISVNPVEIANLTSASNLLVLDELNDGTHLMHEDIRIAT